MIFAMPDGLTLDVLGSLRLRGGLQAAPSGQAGQVAYLWTWQEHQTTLTFDFAARSVSIPDDTHPDQIARLQQVLAEFGQPPAQDAVRRQVLTLAQSAVGVAIQDLTAAQIKALMALVLWDKKAIGDDLKIRPLAEWVIRRPSDGG